MPRPVPHAVEPPTPEQEEEEVQGMEEEVVDRDGEGYGEYVYRMGEAWPLAIDIWALLCSCV